MTVASFDGWITALAGMVRRSSKRNRTPESFQPNPSLGPFGFHVFVHQCRAAKTGRRFISPWWTTRGALGNVWRITSKGRDFYLDATGPLGDSVHISLHGPQGDHAHHRFHVRADARAMRAAREAGLPVGNFVPRKWMQLNGRRICDDVFDVIRSRYRWHLQRSRFRSAKGLSGGAPTFGPHDTGLRMAEPLRPNIAWDIDLYAAFDKPFRPGEVALTRAKGDPRVGPLRNESGMWLTAVSHHHFESRHLAPRGVSPRLPRPGESPRRLSAGGMGDEAPDDVYWFCETITSAEGLGELLA